MFLFVCNYFGICTDKKTKISQLCIGFFFNYILNCKNKCVFCVKINRYKMHSLVYFRYRYTYNFIEVHGNLLSINFVLWIDLTVNGNTLALLCISTE